VSTTRQELETKLVQSISPDGQVLDSASKDLARAASASAKARQTCDGQARRDPGSLDQTNARPIAAVTVRGGATSSRSARPRARGSGHRARRVRDPAAPCSSSPRDHRAGNELRAAERRAALGVPARAAASSPDLLRPHRDAIAAAWEMCHRVRRLVRPGALRES